MGQDWFPPITYGDLLDRAANQFTDSTCLTFRENDWTFGELRHEVDSVAKGLLSLGVRNGDIVALWMGNRPEWLVTALAISRVGAIILPVNTELRSDDLAYIVRDSECTTLIMAGQSGPVSYQDIVVDVWPELALQYPEDLFISNVPALHNVIVLDAENAPRGARLWQDVVAGGGSVSQERLLARKRSVSPHDTALIMYTSGSTSVPKGVVHSHHAIRNVVDQASRLNVRQSDVILMYLPLFHAFGFYEGLLLPLATGAKCILIDRFDPSRTLTQLEQQGATMCFGFTTHFQDLMDHPTFERTDRSSLRAGIMAVGPPSMEHIGYRVQEEFGGKIVSGYGMTEVGVAATLGFIDEDGEHSAATSGYPLSGYEIRVVDAKDGVPCPAGQPGEIVIRTYQMMKGYHKNPRLTESVLDEDGWLHSGDKGVMLGDGYLKVLGRYKDMLRVGGENVDPDEVEAIFLEHPSVQEALLVPVPDERLHEVGCICVVVATDIEESSIEADLLQWCDGRLAAFKRPRYVTIMDAFPKTASGKPIRSEVRSLALDILNLNENKRPTGTSQDA